MRRFLAQGRLRSGSTCGRERASTTRDGGAYASTRPDDEPRFRDERFRAVSRVPTYPMRKMRNGSPHVRLQPWAYTRPHELECVLQHVMGDPDVGARSSCIVAVIAKGTQGTAYILPVVGDSCGRLPSPRRRPSRNLDAMGRSAKHRTIVAGKAIEGEQGSPLRPRPTPPSLSEVYREHQSGNSRRPLRDMRSSLSGATDSWSMWHQTKPMRSFLEAGSASGRPSILSAQSPLDHRTRLFRKPGVCDLRFGEIARAACGPSFRVIRILW